MHTQPRPARPGRRSLWGRNAPIPLVKPRLCRPQVEPLESRCVMYSASGNAWPHPELITISFVPDGTNLGGVTSNLFATFNARFGSAAAWQNKILQAFQAWAQQTNLNFALVSDNGTPSGGGSYQQGDQAYGDIRIGGFNFGGSNLGVGYFPPAGNNYSIAGDLAFNTGKAFNINGTDYDLFTVAVHEIGHALGLGHSSLTTSVMYSAYNGVKTGLKSDDIAGIQSIYGGARAADTYDAAGSNDSFAAATNITSAIDTNAKNALVNADITTTADADYYKFTVPAGMSGSLVVKVQSSGLSLLTPTLKIFNGSQTQVGSTVTGTGYAGGTIQTTVSVTAGATYYVAVDGKDATANGTGRYSMSLTFSGGTAPAVAAPNTQTENGNPLSGSGGIADAQGGMGAYLDNTLNGLLGTNVTLLENTLNLLDKLKSMTGGGCGCGNCPLCCDFLGVSPTYTPHFGSSVVAAPPATKTGAVHKVTIASPGSGVSQWTSWTSLVPVGQPTSAPVTSPSHEPSVVRPAGGYEAYVGNTLMSVAAPRKKASWWNDEDGSN